MFDVGVLSGGNGCGNNSGGNTTNGSWACNNWSNCRASGISLIVVSMMTTVPTAVDRVGAIRATVDRN